MIGEPQWKSADSAERWILKQAEGFGVKIKGDGTREAARPSNFNVY
jgi:hypothetical protein